MDRFWVDFDGGQSAASVLQDAIELSADSVPGEVEAEFDINNATPDSIGFEVRLDSSVLGEVDDYEWTFSSDCGSTAFLNGSNTSEANFTTDVSPCSYDVTLNISNAYGADSITKSVVVDRVPVVNGSNPTASIDAYDPNNGELVIDVDALISGAARADSQSEMLTIIINDEGQGLTQNENIALNNDGDVVYTVPVFDGVDDTFDYKLSDANGSVSESDGTVVVSIAPITVGLNAPSSLSSTTVDLSWSMSDDDLIVDHYVLYRDGSVIEDDILITTYTDSTLSEGNTYSYEVAAVLDSVESGKSDPLAVITAAVPSISNVSPQSSSSVEISWSIAGDDPENYSIYRDGSGTPLKTVDGAVTSTNDTGLDSNVEYAYEVVANFSGSDSDKSDSMSTYTLPAQPTSLSVSNITTSSLRLTWGANGNASGTRYYVCDGVNCSASTTNTFRNMTGIDSNTDKQYSVYADWLGNADSTTNKSANSSTVLTTTFVDYVSDIYTAMFNTVISGQSESRIQRCDGCHGTSGGFTITGGSAALYSELTGSDSRVDSAGPDYIVNCVTGGCNTMSAVSGYAFSASEIATLEDWVSQGAEDD